MLVKEGTLWAGAPTSTGWPKFRVISVTEIEGHTWVHYREEKKIYPCPDCKEFSCYQESFVERFKLIPE